MIDIYKKLVTVAEDMVATYVQHVGDVYEMSVSMQGQEGLITLGVFGLVGSSYHPDENQYMPEYGVTFKSYRYVLVDGEWVEEGAEEVMPVEQKTWVDDLPW